MSVDERLDDYVTRAQEFIGSGDFDEQEAKYKLEIVERLQAAREAVLSGDAEWQDRVYTGLRRDNNLPGWRANAVITNWLYSAPDEPLAALRTLWADDDTPTGERISTFLRQVPDDPSFRGTGTRLRQVSVLLMALGPNYPPFMATRFRSAYERLEYPPAPSGADEAELYQHALGFLDALVDRAKMLGFERPHDRLEAQSVVWMHEDPESADEEPANEASDTTPGAPEPDIDAPPISLDALAEELFVDVGFPREIERLLEEKGQVIFQGPPGTGKTYVARKLAECLAGSPDRVRLVQFHPSYAYEDFVQGFRPTLDSEGRASFKLRPGPLLEMAKQAGDAPRDQKHFLVIDEINRGNLSKVLGELYFLLEYRREKMRLQYDDRLFSLPDNLYIIGTMNTADRSIALVDLALRRRFSFVEFYPDRPPVEGMLRRWLDRHSEGVDWVADVVDHANTKLPDRRAAIGPSYFMRHDLAEETVARIWEHDVLPYVEEQLYGERDRLDDFKLERLRREAAGGGDSSDQPSEAAEDSSGSDNASD